MGHLCVNCKENTEIQILSIRTEWAFYCYWTHREQHREQLWRRASPFSIWRDTTLVYVNFCLFIYKYIGCYSRGELGNDLSTSSVHYHIELESVADSGIGRRVDSIVTADSVQLCNTNAVRDRWVGVVFYSTDGIMYINGGIHMWLLHLNLNAHKFILPDGWISTINKVDFVQTQPSK